MDVAHWSKDYVEHLRAIHLAMLAVCAGLIVLTTLRSPTEVQTAHKQILEVRELLHGFDPSGFEQQCRDQIAAMKNLPRLEISPADANWVTFRFRTRDFQEALGNEATFPFRLGAPNYVLHTKGASPDAALTVSSPSSLRDFHSLWNDLGGAYIAVATKLGDTASVFLWGSDLPYRPATIIFENRNTLLPQPYLEGYNAYLFGVTDCHPPKDSNDLNFVTGLCYSGIPVSVHPSGQFSRDYGLKVFLPVVSTENFSFDGQAVLISHARHEWDWKHGDFSSSFRQLNDVTRDYDGLDVENIERILASEEKRTGESFEAVGIKFPAENTARWGILVILGLQVYLWLQLRERSSKLSSTDAGWEVAWIGVYPSAYSKFATFLSIVALPVVTVLALGTRVLYLSSFAVAYWIVLIGATASTLMLGGLAWLHLVGLHRQQLRVTAEGIEGDNDRS
jgi:hypothetical protein